jgi:hypothetical protein
MASSTNGATTTVTEPPPDSPVDDDRYRPKASTAKVHAQIEEGLREIVAEAATQLVQFMHLTWADRKAGTAIVYGHVVDASECLELAALHLDMLKTAVGHRLRIEDDKNGADLPF